MKMTSKMRTTSKTNVHWQSTRGAVHIPLEISRFRSSIHLRCGHFLFYWRWSIAGGQQGPLFDPSLSECRCVCSTAQLMWSLEFSFPIHLKIEIHVFVPSTEPFLSDIRERRNKFFNYPIWQQLLASSKSSSIKRIIHRITVVNSQQCYTCWVNKLGKP